MKCTDKKRAYRGATFDAIGVAVLIAYLLYFALPAVRGGFREDEMMNTAIYWRAGMLKSLLANVTFWTALYRPGGGLYYLPLYDFFGLNPLPYRIVQISILALSIPMVYYLSCQLASWRSVAFLAVLALCYHPRLANLVFVGAFIYDVLCGFFYFAALTYYVHIRERQGSLRPGQLMGFLALYVCALNCKEMAVSLPVIVLIYELLKGPHWQDWKAFVRWSWVVAGPSLIAGLLTAIYVYGKTHGGGSLINIEPYRPKFSWNQFITSNAKFVGELLFTRHAITPEILLALWAAVFIYALIRRDCMVRLMAFWVVIVPLPIAFLLPMRGGGSLYLLLFGWAMIFSKVASDLIGLTSRCWIFVRRRVGLGATSRGTADGAADARSRTAVPQIFRVLAMLLVALALAIFMRQENQRLRRVPALLKKEQKVLHVVAALKSLDLQPAPGSTVLLTVRENLFSNKWNALFITSLVWNDHSLRIWLEGGHKLTPSQMANIDYIILLTEFEAKVIRAPGMPQPY